MTPATTVPTFSGKPNTILKPVGGAADVTDIEYQTAERHKERNEISESRNNFICDILSTHTGHTDDGPDI